MKNGFRELRIARHHRLADTQPWLDRPFKRFTAPDAESADVIQEEVRPVLRRKQQNRIRPGRRQFPLYGMVAANKPVDLPALYLLRPPVVRPELDAIRVVAEPLVAAIPAGHALAGKPSLSMKDIDNQPFVMYAP